MKNFAPSQLILISKCGGKVIAEMAKTNNPPPQKKPLTTFAGASGRRSGKNIDYVLWANVNSGDCSHLGSEKQSIANTSGADENSVPGHSMEPRLVCCG